MSPYHPTSPLSPAQVMERLRGAITPKEFSVIKVTKSTLEFLRFDAEIENKQDLPLVVSKIDQKVRIRGKRKMGV